MTITPDQYEKLGTFYLGREYDVGTKEMNENLVLYDSKDLVTHGVVLGMTGSGKTGLCLSLLEEALLSGDPRMKDHLKESHRLLISHDELAHLLTIEEISKLMAASQEGTEEE